MTTCGRCGVTLDGFGVLHGMVTSTADPDTGAAVTGIYCYANGCRCAILGRLVHHGDEDGVCSRCGDPTVRAPDLALLTTDLHDDAARMLTFCRANGCADLILTRAEVVG